MAKNDVAKRKKRRKDPMVGLVIGLVIFALLAGGAWYAAGELRDYRAGLLSEKQQEVEARNAQKQAAYEAEVQAYKKEISSNQGNKAWPAAQPTGWDVIDLTTYPLEAPGKITVNKADVLYGGMLLVNEWHSRPDTFDESQMVALYSYARDSGLNSFWENSSCKLHPTAIDALIELIRAAKELGYTHYVVEGGYNFRSLAEQNEMFEKELARQRESRPTLSEEQLKERAKKNVNLPGTSEYNSGMAFRLYLYERENAELKTYYKETPFYQTADGQWLLENAWRYGFVFRFPTVNYPTTDTVDKSYKTGMSQRTNLYRYVGKGNAAVMYHLDLCLEEYIEYLQEHPHIAVFENGKKRFEITRQQVDDSAESFAVEINRLTNNYTMSLDNFGGLITVYEY